jgi:hypothetical protein
MLEGGAERQGCTAMRYEHRRGAYAVGCAMQEDVMDWVCELICDALRFAVLHEEGGDIALVTGHEAPQGSTAHAVELLVSELRKALIVRTRAGARPGQIALKYSFEQVCRILKVFSLSLKRDLQLEEQMVLGNRLRAQARITKLTYSSFSESRCCVSGFCTICDIYPQKAAT